MTLDSSIFKAYDIRGIVGSSLTIDGVKLIGKAIGSSAKTVNQFALDEMVG